MALVMSMLNTVGLTDLTFDVNRTGHKCVSLSSRAEGLHNNEDKPSFTNRDVAATSSLSYQDNLIYSWKITCEATFPSFNWLQDTR